ncbi:hypothetical protein ATK74_2298 [Propionicimonas paludicola]|uniref:Uncharacterized protein n=1 Tax=Propionicimonas paludicola TaxID=185243 RepID=A0A2A9CUI9_9ACTN|nr:hypothetical protein ATK74_2298 [Propionicimonas paludicola]
MTHLSMTAPNPGAEPIADLSKAPLPTARTLRARRNIGLQFLRFLSFNTRIMRMVVKGHK